MRKFKHIFALVLCLLVFFTACDGSDPDYDEDEEEIEEEEDTETKKPNKKTEKKTEKQTEEIEETEETKEIEETEDIEESEETEESELFEESEEDFEEDVEESELIQYVIICPSGSSVRLQNIAKGIRDEIKKTYGIELKVKNDKLKNSESVETIPDYEIVVGDTNRPASGEGYDEADGGWWVKNDGNRIVINAGTVDGIKLAADYFVENYKYDEDTGVISLDDDKQKTVSEENAFLDKKLSLKVGTYNIKNGELAGHDMTQMGAIIKSLDLDIVGLQEVDIETNRAGKKNILKLLAEAAGYEYYAFAKALDMPGGGEYGTAVMSHYPISSFETKLLDVTPGTEQRVMGCAKINVDGAELAFVSTHFSLDESVVRARQFEQVLEYAKQYNGYIVTGDFNVDNVSEFTALSDVLLANEGDFLTFPATNGHSAIDEIILDYNWKVTKHGINQVEALSDHSLFWAEIIYNGGK